MPKKSSTALPRKRRTTPPWVKDAADRAEGKKTKKPRVAIDPVIKRAEVPETASPEPKARMGRPSSYKPEYVEQAAKLCEHGLTDEEIARFFKVHIRTLQRWKGLHPEFCRAIKIGGSVANERVARSLYHRACGYTYDAVKIMQHQGVVIKEKHKEHVPPETTAAIFWLKNRDPGNWRDVNRYEHTGKDGGAIAVESGDKLELARWIAHKLGTPATAPSDAPTTH